MVGVVYIGNNPQSEERLKYLPGKHVIFKKDYSEAASECNTRKLYDHYIIFLEKTSPCSHHLSETKLPRHLHHSAYIWIVK